MVVIFCDCVAPVHEVHRRMGVSKTHRLQSINAILTTDLRKQLYTASFYSSLIEEEAMNTVVTADLKI